MINKIKLSLFVLLLINIMPFVSAYDNFSNISAENHLEKYKIDNGVHYFTPNKSVDIQSDLINIINNKKPYLTHTLHVYLQFNEDLGDYNYNELKYRNITLYPLNNNKNWIASIPIANQFLLDNSRWVGEIPIEHKIRLNLSKIVPYMINDDGTLNVEVTCFKDVEIENCQEIISKYGIVHEQMSSDSYRLSINENLITELAKNDAVYTIGKISPVIDLLKESRIKVEADNIQESPYNLNGLNTNITMWEVDGKVNQSHPDINGRVVFGDSGTIISTHATIVGIIIVGNGTIKSDYRGIAPNAKLISYDHTGERSEHRNAINNDSVISQNSWGTNMSIELGNCADFATYNADDPTEQTDYDNIVRGDEYGSPITIVFSAGNQQDGGNCNINTNGYSTLTPQATAKNAISVGAIYSDSNKVTCFSAWGPTDDGRIKPDIVAPGDEGSCGTSDGKAIEVPQPDSNNWISTGTSFAAPLVSGTIALMIQQYKNSYSQFFPSPPLPSTIKAILMQTATDINNTGPDYTSGYGLINATAAIDMIINRKILERQLNYTGENDTYNIVVAPNESILKITLVWDDIGGKKNSSQDIYNDIDVTLVSPDNLVYYPWKLNKTNVSLPATRGVDHTNNAEQIFINNPTEGLWIINVSAHYIYNGYHQKYSLVGTHLGYKKIFYIYNFSIYIMKEAQPYQ